MSGKKQRQARQSGISIQARRDMHAFEREANAVLMTAKFNRLKRSVRRRRIAFVILVLLLGAAIGHAVRYLVS